MALEEVSSRLALFGRSVEEGDGWDVYQNTRTLDDYKSDGASVVQSKKSGKTFLLKNKLQKRDAEV
jgi:hypothetical protein